MHVGGWLSPLYLVESPMYLVESPMYLVESPMYLVESPMYLVKYPMYLVESPMQLVDSPILFAFGPKGVRHSVKLGAMFAPVCAQLEKSLYYQYILLIE